MEVGCRLKIWWLLVDGTRSQFEATIEAVDPRRKRKYRIRLEDGQVRWSKLARRKRFDVLPPASSYDEAAGNDRRPYYIGATDPGCARAWVVQTLRTYSARRSMLDIDGFYMCVGGLSGFDALAVLLELPARPRRVVLFDRDEGALGFGRLMVSLVAHCASRAVLMRALFGRCPTAWARTHAPLSPRTMLEFLSTEADEPFLASVREALPPAQRPLYDTVLRAACAGLDWGDQPPERGMVGLPARRIWPCWGLRRCRREGNPVRRMRPNAPRAISARHLRMQSPVSRFQLAAALGAMRRW